MKPIVGYLIPAAVTYLILFAEGLEYVAELSLPVTGIFVLTALGPFLGAGMVWHIWSRPGSAYLEPFVGVVTPEYYSQLMFGAAAILGIVSWAVSMEWVEEVVLLLPWCLASLYAFGWYVRHLRATGVTAAWAEVVNRLGWKRQFDGFRGRGTDPYAQMEGRIGERRMAVRVTAKHGQRFTDIETDLRIECDGLEIVSTGSLHYRGMEGEFVGADSTSGPGVGLYGPGADRLAQRLNTPEIAEELARCDRIFDEFRIAEGNCCARVKREIASAEELIEALRLVAGVVDRIDEAVAQI